MPRRRSRGDLHTASPGGCRPAWRIPARRRDTAGWKCARLCHSAPRVLQSDANRPGGSWDAAVSAAGGLCQRFLSVPRVTAAMRSLLALCVRRGRRTSWLEMCGLGTSVFALSPGQSGMEKGFTVQQVVPSEIARYCLLPGACFQKN